MVKKQRITAVVLAGGKGVRAGGNYKQFFRVGGKPVLFYSLDEFLKCRFVHEIVLVVPIEKLGYAKRLIFGLHAKDKKKISIIAGGETRQASTCHAINYLKSKDSIPDYVFFHDAARPFVRKDVIAAVLRGAVRSGGAVAGMPTVDLLLCVRRGIATQAFRKASVYSGHTPQCFRFSLIAKAHENAPGTREYSLDNIELLQRRYKNLKIELIDSPHTHFKVTHATDLAALRMIVNTQLA